jgi:hypothetical protein
VVEFVDRRDGREMIHKLLPAVSNEEAMKILGTTEGKFLDAWKARVGR